MTLYEEFIKVNLIKVATENHSTCISNNKNKQPFCFTLQFKEIEIIKVLTRKLRNIIDGKLILLKLYIIYTLCCLLSIQLKDKPPPYVLINLVVPIIINITK